MKRFRFLRVLASTLIPASCLAALVSTAAAQADTAPKPAPKSKYVVSQSFDLGGHIVEYSGSGAVYATLINLHSGPRILEETLTAHSVAGAQRTIFDSLDTESTGYGGDPNSFTTLRFSKGKLYDFQGFFRRDRQYFDYDLFGNPLIPPGVTTTTGYTFPQVDSAPHLFNTVRQMTNANLTLLPLSKISFRAGYVHTMNQGPSYSSVHYGTEALLYQGWRNGTDNWLGAVDWRPLTRTTITYEEYITHYKGDTYWQLTGLNLQLANGAPVTLGFDNTTVPACGNHGPAVTTIATTPPTANPTCNGFLQYTRTEPTRVLFPTEMFRLTSGDLKNVQVTALVRYTGANMNLPNYFEYFNGLETRTTLRAATVTGAARAKRINVGANLGVVWALSPRVNLTEQYAFQDFRQPGVGFLSEVDQDGTSMLAAPGPPLPPAITSANNFLGQKTSTNTVTAEFLGNRYASVSVGYRFRSRSLAYVQSVPTDALPAGADYTFSDQENSGLLGLRFQPLRNWRVNADFEVGWANNAYVQIDPRQWQRYNVGSQWQAKSWARLSASFVDWERRDNVTDVDYRAHNRAFNAAASFANGSHYGVDLNYSYTDAYSRVTECFADSAPPPPSATPLPPGFVCGNVTAVSPIPGFFGNGYYDAPTQFGSIIFTINPFKPLQTDFGYHMTAINGHTELLNPRAVEGSLQSQYQTPFATAIWTIEKGWGVRGDWNYYSYGEGSPIGPTLPRSFRGNVFTIAVHNEF
jgi:hypothetical protein